MRGIAFAFVVLLCASCSAQPASDSGCGVATPYSMGAGVTVVHCWGSADGSVGVSSIGTGKDGGGLTAGDAALIFGYQCFGGAANPCTAAAPTDYLLPCYSFNCADGPLTGICTLIYQGAIPVNPNYPYYAWYCPSLPPTHNGVALSNGISLVCSSTSPTFTPSSQCDYPSEFLTEFTGQCSLAGTGCFDASGNAAGGTTGGACGANYCLTVATTAATKYTNELVCALGGTANHEVLSSTNNGLIMSPGNSAEGALGNTVFCKIAATEGVQNLGQSWTGHDIGGMILITLRTAQSASTPSPPSNLNASPVPQSAAAPTNPIPPNAAGRCAALSRLGLSLTL